MINLDNRRLLSESASILPDVDSIKIASGNSIMEINEQALYENEANWNAIETYIEQRQLQEASIGEDYILSEGFLGDFFNKLKEWVVALYKKVVAMFKKFIAMMDSYILTDKEFVKKYTGELSKVTLKDTFSIKGYIFTIGPITEKIYSTDDNVDVINDVAPSNSFEVNADGDDIIIKDTVATTKFVKDYYADTESYYEKIVANIYNGIVPNAKETSMTTTEFRDQLFEELRDGEKSKTTLDNTDVNIGTSIAIISNYKAQKTKAEKCMTKTKKACDAIIKACDRLGQKLVKPDAKTAVENEEKIKIAHILGGTWRKTLTCTQTAMALVLSALKAENRQAKNVCVKALTKSKESFKEDVDIRSYSTLEMPKLI